MTSKTKSAFADKKMIGRAIKESFIKLNPKTQVQNPVMLLVYLSAILTTVLWIVSLFGLKDASSGYTFSIAVILLFTCVFANFAEAIAEGRGKAQADALRASKKDVEAHKIPSADKKELITNVSSATLKKGDIVIVKAGEQIPGDGEVIEGAASVDESAITGESAPVIREAGGDRSAVTGGTTVLSDWIVVQITSEAGASFLDKMIAMVEGAARKKTPNEIALQIFLVALSIIFILVTMSLYAYSAFSAKQAGIDNPTSITTLVALLVCLAPTTIGALLSAIGIAGMSRLNQANVLAMSGRAIEAAGDVDILMLDKTGTITLGNRQAHAFIPVDGVSEEELADAAQLSSLADETPEGRSVVILAKEKYRIRGRELADKHMIFVPFTAKTRMSGVDFDGNEIRKGAAESMQAYVTQAGGVYSEECAGYDGFDTDVEWMKQYGCVQVIEEENGHEKLRPQWKQLMASLERGDEIVLAKFSNALRGSRELAAFIEFCRVKVVRIISIHDRVDSRGDLFPETKVADVLEIFGALPEECAALRKASAHIIQLKQNINQLSKENNISKAEREKTIVAMYNNGHSIDDIWKVSGFSSRSSVFRILNKYGVSLNRGKFSGPLGKRKPK